MLPIQENSLGHVTGFLGLISVLSDVCLYAFITARALDEANRKLHMVMSDEILKQMKPTVFLTAKPPIPVLT